ncbi:hypothetical protein [Aromatoleum anaerobium]|uniref:DUF3995 domain-containing protein n=1 Tax=Aromatoleum anaerobium TaxID=182180 RepID=A0ABX1PPR0_9RHOO|nr:hypothetical protein [Aromatoleum anaerobium]MCK0507061.1 hypothetical protein [Aromatoleum anaerobium]
MRTFQALAIVLCVFGAIHLLQGPAFFWPDRFDPSHGVLLGGLSSRLLGAGLVVVAALGLMAGRQAGRGDGRAAPPRWQLRYFLLILLALGLASTAFTIGERGPNPDWRAPASEGVQPT